MFLTLAYVSLVLFLHSSLGGDASRSDALQQEMAQMRINQEELTELHKKRGEVSDGREAIIRQVGSVVSQQLLPVGVLLLRLTGACLCLLHQP